MNEQANSRQAVLQNARKQIIHSLLLAVAALGVLAFACYAWFTNNTRVTGTGVSISVEGSRFELASVGDTAPTDPSIPTEWYIAGGDNWSFGNKSGLITTVSHQTVLWRVDSDSNLGNLSDKGIQPGSSGKLKFYVIPKLSGELKLTFRLELVPQLISGAENSIVNNLLRGHLLFHYQCEGADTSTWVECQSREFHLNLNVSENVPILITLNWQWPYVLNDVVENAVIRGWMVDYPAFFFYNGGTVVSAPSNDDLDNHLREYSDYYNNADQYIGENVSGLLLKMIVVEG